MSKRVFLILALILCTNLFPSTTFATAASSATTATQSPESIRRPASPESTPGSTVISRPTVTPGPASFAVPAPTPAATREPTESGVTDSPRPFTPDGTGTVVDNVTDADGKEFFTIVTEDENTFFLIIDRQRDNKNVYLLNAVTEDDLAVLAEKSSGSESAIPISTPKLTPTPTPQPESTPEPTPEPESKPETPQGTNTGAILLIVVSALGVGGAGYYFKIIKPRQDAARSMDDDYDDENEDESGETGDERVYDDYSGEEPRVDEDKEQQQPIT